tara:strand:+ start:25 stop:255 length:231 start_codon:yes stop_codon:yes gene_type:complete
MRFDDYDTQIQCEEVYPDPHTDDDEDFLPDEDDGLLWDEDNDFLREEEDGWFTDDGGLTADAYDWLAEQDKQHGFC